MSNDHQVREKIVVIPYKTMWKEQFSRAKKDLKDCLGDTVIAIEHIGSTSIKGLAAKDRIDIQISVKEVTEEVCHDINKKLEELSLSKAFMTRDHLPPWDNNLENWKKIYLQGFTAHWDFKCNIHIRAVGLANHDYALLFRDYLRSDEECKIAYKNFKVTLADYMPDNRDAYSDIKDPFCDMIMINARKWAIQTDWKPQTTTGE